MKSIKSLMATAMLSISVLGFSLSAAASEYIIDTNGAHAFINFKISHLGFSWVHGNFKNFKGTFSFDAVDPTKSKVNVEIDTGSIDSGHAERDKHIRGDKYLNSSEFPKAYFVSKRIENKGKNNVLIYGDLTIKGIKKPIVIDAVKIGEGKDPWGGYRAGFSGTTSINLADFNIASLGPTATKVYLTLDVEGIRKEEK
ncbi:MAG: YceI family protein [Endozoicomonas sp. (ex Botrylloides leachii)]|nr:YceI family protein [Endozoicomonas sp. (ex Botrylloides leachii)]